MRIMSILTNVAVTGLFVGVTIAHASGGSSAIGDVGTPAGAHIDYAGESKVPRIVVEGAPSLAFDPPLKREIEKANESFVVGNKTIVDGPHTYLLMALLTPSRPGAHGQGPCGAGWEDTLLLLEVERETTACRARQIGHRQLLAQHRSS
jgi:hypothetical protein